MFLAHLFSMVSEFILNGLSMDSGRHLPLVQHLSSHTLSFFNHNLQTNNELLRASLLASDLQTHCLDLNQILSDLNLRLRNCLVTHAFFSGNTSNLLCKLSARLGDLSFSTRMFGYISDEEGREKLCRAKQILGEELPTMAKEVARVETVRIYSETALKLGTLIGDIEDTVCSTMKKNPRRHSYPQDTEELLLAIKTLMLIEDVLTTVTQTGHHWSCLVSAVDNRVDQALAILRPHAIANHRSLLPSLGWPPPLYSLNHFESDKRTSAEISSLFTKKGDLKDQYCDSFLALCSLQGLQSQRKSRQLEGHNLDVAMHQPLWAIEELVNPISISCQHHFSKWADKPELVFALVYKKTSDYVDSVDTLLQPLVDKAMLVGYSCREEWISAMVVSLSTYLAKEMFPRCVDQLEESVSGGSFLDLVDLMVTFDKQIYSLLSHSSVSFQESGDLQKISSFSVFCDQPDWLDTWAEIELHDALDKLKPAMEDEKRWTRKLDDYKSPAVTSISLQILLHIVTRCQSLPTSSLRSRFFSLSAMAVLQNFFDCLLLRCQEAEALTALADDDALIKVVTSINAARHLESVLREWCDDVFFLEMGSGQNGQSCVFDEQIGKLEEFMSDWVKKVSVSVLRGFDVRCQDHLRNKKQRQETGEGMVSRSFVETLDYLQGKCCLLEENLNGSDFFRVWRSLASGVDQLMFSSILGNVKFYDVGVESLGRDLEVLFGVFRAWCLRPEGFFPRASEGLRTLRMRKEQLEDCLERGEQWMKEKRIGHLTLAEVKKIARSRGN